MPCRHLGSVSLSRLPSLLANRRLSGSCAACPEPTFLCLGCAERYCRQHFARHSGKKNHPVAVEVQERLLYCGNCQEAPKVQSAKDKKLLAAISEEVSTLLGEDKQLIKDTDLVKDTDSKETQLGLPPKGISNLGNTCFMNATLQSLNAVLSDSFLASFSNDPSSRILHCLCSALQQLRSTTTASKQRTLLPRDLLNAISSRYQKFALLQQQDAHEFLRCLFNCIKDEGGGAALRPFSGKIMSRVRCGRCRRVSDTEEPCLDVSLSLSALDNGNLDASMSKLSLNDGDDDSINRLFSLWSQPIELKGENGYHCEACSPSDSSVLQDASLVYKLVDPPELLIIHLQRFKTVIRAAKKNKNKANLVMDVEKDHRLLHYPRLLTLPSQSLLYEREPVSYELASFIEHDGASTSSGHYTAVVRVDGRWYHASDTRVTSIPEGKALNPEHHQPYLLFYRRK